MAGRPIYVIPAGGRVFYGGRGLGGYAADEIVERRPL